MPAVGCRKGHRPRQESRQPPQPQTREEQLPHDNNALGTHLLQTIAGLAKQVQTIQNQHTEIYQKIDKIEKRQQENYSTYGRQDLKFQTMDRRMEKIETVSEQQNRTIKELMNDKYERLDHEVSLEWKKPQKNIVKDENQHTPDPRWFQAPNDRNTRLESEESTTQKQHPAGKTQLYPPPPQTLYEVPLPPPPPPPPSTTNQNPPPPPPNQKLSPTKNNNMLTHSEDLENALKKRLTKIRGATNGKTEEEMVTEEEWNQHHKFAGNNGKKIQIFGKHSRYAI